MKHSNLELTIGILVCLLGALLFWNTYTFPPPLQANAPSSATFPRIIIAMMMFFGILMIYQCSSSKRKPSADSEATIFNRTFLTAVGLIVLYLALLPYLGFVAASFIYLGLTLTTRIKGRIKAVLVSAIGVACFYLIFAVLLNVRLPRLHWPG